MQQRSNRDQTPRPMQLQNIIISVPLQCAEYKVALFARGRADTARASPPRIEAISAIHTIQIQIQIH